MESTKLQIARAIGLATEMPKRQIAELLESPPDPALGDLAFPCFALAKRLKKNPQLIASDLAKKIKLPKSSLIKKTQATGPYVNFFFDPKALAKCTLARVLKQKARYGAGPRKRKKVMIEFSNPNTHKAFHVGHLRNACIGDALVRTVRFYGYPVVSANYINDTGAHVARCLWCYLKFHKGEEPTSGKANWLSKIYVEAVRRLPKSSAYKQEVAELHKKLEAGDQALVNLWQRTRQWSLDELKKIYDELGVHFDAWFFDNKLAGPGKAIVNQLLKANIAKTSEGAIIVDLKEYGLDIALLLKSDGTALYLTKDLALAKEKFEKYKIDMSVYVVAAPQTLHFKQLFKILELAHFHQAKNCFHLPYELVMLKEGKMASRLGNVVFYTELAKKVKIKALHEVTKRNPKLSVDKRKDVAKKVAIAALKYGMLKQSNNKVIIFDWKAALDFEGNTGPYLQYALVRAKKIMAKAGKKVSKSDLNALKNTEEFSLVKRIAEFPTIIEKTAQSYQPHLLANYSYNLAQAFNSFYESCPVIQATPKELMSARLALVAAFSQTLKNALNLLGIEEVELM